MRSGALEDFVDGIECEEGDEEEVVEGGPNSGLDALVHRYAAELCADRKEGDSEAADVGDRDESADVGGVATAAAPALKPAERMAHSCQLCSVSLTIHIRLGQCAELNVRPSVQAHGPVHAAVKTMWHLAEAKEVYANEG